jgi:protein phosphatase
MLEQMSNEELLMLFSSDAADKEKQKKLIEATVNNQDNHTAWLIHIKDVVKEPDDEDLENEEPVARCNALNIIPKVIEANEDDVVIVQEVKKTKSLLQRMKEVVDSIMNTKK